MNQKCVKVAIAGLGGRGKDTYAECALRFPRKMQITAIADPVEEKRRDVAGKFHIPEEMCFSSAEELLAAPKMADVLFICTQDRMHYAHAIPALQKGYHLLIEKPISPIASECAEIAAAARKYHRHVQVCHVLRYTPFFQEIKRIIREKTIGEIVAVQAKENVQYWHQAHSYVRGNWAKAEESSPMILAKSCHDMDILLWLADKAPKYVSSYGSLFLFRPEKAPEGAAPRCLEDCKVRESCPYNAERFYIHERLLQNRTQWPLNILNIHPTEENIRQALKEGNYGKCVYYAGNNVVDHQVVNAELEDGVTLSFTMSAFTSRGGRHLHIMGTLGDIEADMDRNLIRTNRFGQEPELTDVTTLAQDFSGHGGGDFRMVEELLDDIAQDREPGCGLPSVSKSVMSHYLALAAEESRIRHGRSIAMEEWIREHETLAEKSYL